jgi:CheY-like chemotaxis protein
MKLELISPRGEHEIIPMEYDNQGVWYLRLKGDYEAYKYRYVSYVNGKEAIDDFKRIIENNEEVPEVIFLDINMPIMDGWQFLEEFITLPIAHKIRINILTSSIDPADRENWQYYMTRTHHIIDYKNKPIQKKEIEEITKAA